ncbi:hypothetical protein [uncultured Draconibacterium sp.]|uniref:hypothetical protein n=1 Tax=uncultured Draconibacterium sp. TaxID=1573823 RepID=UPI00321713F5
MTFSNTYKPLFQVNIFHLYYLNKGTQEYLSMSEAEKEKQLICYDISNFFTVLPSTKSRQTIMGHQLVFKLTNSGFIVWTKISESNNSHPFLPLSDDLELSFLLKLKNHTFFNFSNLKLDYANKLFFFSNKRLNTEPGSFPLIKKSGNNSPVSDNYALETISTSNLLNELDIHEKQNLFGIVKVVMKGNTASLNITNNQGNIRNPFPVFEIIFENRKTFWRYFFTEDQQVDGSDDVKKESGSSTQLITRQKQPLTASGFVSIQHGEVELPNPDAKLVKPDSSNNKIYSEIYM